MNAVIEHGTPLGDDSIGSTPSVSWAWTKASFYGSGAHLLVGVPEIASSSPAVQDHPGNRHRAAGHHHGSAVASPGAQWCDPHVYRQVLVPSVTSRLASSYGVPQLARASAAPVRRSSRICSAA